LGDLSAFLDHWRMSRLAGVLEMLEASALADLLNVDGEDEGGLGMRPLGPLHWRRAVAALSGGGRGGSGDADGRSWEKVVLEAPRGGDFDFYDGEGHNGDGGGGSGDGGPSVEGESGVMATAAGPSVESPPPLAGNDTGVAQIMDMFPEVTSQQAQRALEDTNGSLQGAIELIISQASSWA